MNCKKSKTRRRRFPYLFIGCAALWLCGCMAPAVQVDRYRVCPPPPPAMEKVLARQAQKITLQALADLEIQVMGKKYPLRVALLMKNPDGLRMESIPLIGPPDFMLSTQADRLRVFFPEKGEFYLGLASRHLPRFVPVPIPVTDIVALLMGNFPPLKPGDCLSAASATGDLRQIDIITSDGRIRQSLWIKWPEQSLMKLQSDDPAGTSRYSAVFSDYTTAKDLIIPQKIVIRANNTSGIQHTLTVRYTDVEVADESASSLELAIPPNVRPLELRDDAP